MDDLENFESEAINVIQRVGIQPDGKVSVITVTQGTVELNLTSEQAFSLMKVLMAKVGRS